ncbi:FAD-binding domain-containing protein [Apiospora phragmitis]|uniref:FAD-binding domain-containing protein n=1 Tax=Apiospora phragmitis TaxID=2905665 RepID=A0ABR1U786_9PEZI
MELTVDSEAAERAALACQALQQQNAAITITTAQNTSYEAEQERRWSQACWLPAAGYVRPQDAAEVAAVLATSKKANTKFAVRSTGHHPNADFSSVDQSGGVIDLRDIKSLSLDEDMDGKFILRAGGGSTLTDVYIFLRSAVAPSSAPATLVSGWVVSISATKYAVHIYDPSDYVSILKATVQVQESIESDSKIGLFVSFNPTFVAVGLLYADAPTEIPAAFKPFLDLTSLLNMAVLWTDGTIKSLVGSIQYNAPRARWVAAGSWQDPSLDKQAIRDVDNLRIGVEKLAKSSGDHLGFVFMNDASPTQTVLGGTWR